MAIGEAPRTGRDDVESIGAVGAPPAGTIQACGQPVHRRGWRLFARRSARSHDADRLLPRFAESPLGKPRNDSRSPAAQRYTARAEGRPACTDRLFLTKYVVRPSRPEGCRLPLPGEPDPPSPNALGAYWASIERVLREEVTDFTFHIWLEPLEPVGHVGGTLFLRAPDHIRSWVQDSFLPLLRRAAETSGVARSIEIVDPRGQPPAAPQANGGAPVAGEPLNPRYTFERFVICDGNRLAHGAALAVAEQPAQAYNPLFSHGPPGLGKTHLLHAIGNYVQAFGAGLTVRYVTVEDFTSEFVRAVRSGETRAFRARFRGADVLLVDDVQFLAEKLRTEEEFFHTFNALYEPGSQLVITSDRRPRDIEKLETRLRERFECGLVAQLDAPNLDARLAILAQRARADALAGV